MSSLFPGVVEPRVRRVPCFRSFFLRLLRFSRVGVVQGGRVSIVVLSTFYSMGLFAFLGILVLYIVRSGVLGSGILDRLANVLGYKIVLLV